MPVSIGWPVAEVGDLAKLKLNMCPDEEVGWVWPCVGGGCGEGVDFRGDWVELSVAADGESSCTERDESAGLAGTLKTLKPLMSPFIWKQLVLGDQQCCYYIRTDSCLMLSLEKSMEGLVLRRSASSSSLNGVTQALVGVLLRGVIAPAGNEDREVVRSPVSV